MPLLDLDFASVPDKVLPVEQGEYQFIVTKCDFAEAKGKQLDRYAVTLKVKDGPMKDRTIFDNFPIEYLRDPTHMSTIRFKHLTRSAGFPPTLTQFNTDELVNKECRGLVIHKNGKDEAGNIETYANIKDYVY